MLTKAEEARIANDKARINDLVSTEVLASCDNKGELDQKTLIKNLEGMPANVTGLDEYKENLESGNEPIWPMEFQVDGYNVTVEWNGKVTVGDPGEGGSTPIPSDKTLTEITLSIEPKEINVGETATLTATMTPPDADDTLNFTAEPAENVQITTQGTTAIIEGVKAGEVTITVSGTKTSITAQCTVTVKAVEVAKQALEEGEFNYLGYYAYLDGDDEPDGIIYADLATDKEGQWSDNVGVYKYTNKKGSGLRKYTVVEEERSSEKFGGYTAPGIRVAEGGGKIDRFYVMALEDVDNSTHYWYYNGYSKKLDTDKVIDSSVKDFEVDSGKQNTKDWLEKYNDTKYQSSHGVQNNNDMWKIIEGNLNACGKEWFVPSKVEWAAFADMLTTEAHEIDPNKEALTTSNYGDFGLSIIYWSSSQSSADNAYTVRFLNGLINFFVVDYSYCVRLSTTF